MSRFRRRIGIGTMRNDCSANPTLMSRSVLGLETIVGIHSCIYAQTQPQFEHQETPQ